MNNTYTFTTVHTCQSCGTIQAGDRATVQIDTFNYNKLGEEVKQYNSRATYMPVGWSGWGAYGVRCPNCPGCPDGYMEGDTSKWYKGE